MDGNPEGLTAAVAAHYGAIARQAAQAEACATPGCACFGAALYPVEELAGLPAGAVAGAQGCGNPTALAELRPGEVVLDLGSGGGIDVILAARRVGPAGRGFGLDMTQDMLALARENARRAGVENTEFLEGRIESIPLPAAAVDVVISNCVVNLSPDKGRVCHEAFRVLRPGGRLAISDVVLRDPGPGEAEIPEAVRRSIELWAGCLAGALVASDYRRLLVEAGFTDIAIEELRRYTAEDMGGPLQRALGEAGLPQAEAVAGRFASALLRGSKPRPLLYFLCTGNACRSQMAEGFARAALGGAVTVASAGIAPAGLHPLAVAVMAEVGVDISAQASKPIDPALLGRAALVVTLCGDARERCPVTPPGVRRLHWDLPDPARAPGDDPARLSAFRAVRDEIRRRVEALAPGPA